ncbi:MAG: cell division protein FtsZ, partial [Bacteroidetes bacterium]
TQQAELGIQELQQVVDTMIVIDNNNLHKILGPSVSMKKAFEEADQVLCNAAKGIAEIITTEGYINVDFADVCTVMRDGGKALMGTALAEGETRAINAVESAINSPLLDNIDIEGARAIIVNITASEDSLRMDETTEIVEYVQGKAGHDANIIYGIVYDESMGEKLRVTVIATRFNDKKEPIILEERPARKKQIEMPVAIEEEEESPSLVARTPDRRLERHEREERIQKLNSKTYDIHDPDSLSGLESEPAYLRKRVTLDMDRLNDPLRLSRSSVEADKDRKYRLRENNAFLHDNVD